MADNQQPTDQPAEYVSPPPPQSIMDNLKFWQLSTLAVGLTLLIIIGAYFYTKSRQSTPQLQPQLAPTVPFSLLPTSLPTPIEETTDLQTYTNAEYGYEVKYPSGYKADPKLLDLSRSNPLWLQNIFFYTITPLAGGGPTPWISVIVWKNDSHSLQAWLDNHSTTESFDSEKIPSSQTALYFNVLSKSVFNMINKSGFKFTSQTMNGPVERVVLSSGQYIYEISLWTNNNLRKDSEINKNYQTILSTFKFLN